MGKYLKPGKLSQARCTYFKPEGASFTLYSAKVNANLADISDGNLKARHSMTISKKDPEVAESLIREATAIQRQFLRLTDLLVALTQRLDQPDAASTI